MDIKEIALKVAMDTGLYLDGANQSEPFYVVKPEEIVEFAEALISAYKAELLNEVGEPVAVTNHAQLGYVTDGMHPDIPLAMWAKETSYSGANIALYTSDQVAAAIAKATKPLEERIKWLQDFTNKDGEVIKILEDQLSKAEQRVAEWVSVETQLPGEQGFDSEEVLCFLNGHCSITDFECRQGGGWGIRLGYYDADISMFRTHGRPDNFVTHWMLLPKAPNGASS